jgi:hypothetical protein
MKTKIKIGLILAALACARAQAYVTSAILEFSVDDKAGFSLNGSPILEKSDFAPFNYDVLSTSDGTLPMELFNAVGDNLLAVEDFDVEGYNMSISYRFTIHQSEGDPIVIWGVPNTTKMLHLHKTQPSPEGWKSNNFDDSSWGYAIGASGLQGTSDAFPGLYDAAFGGLFGTGAYVPRLSHVFNMNCNTADHNLFRSHFKFPDHPAKVTALINPPKAVLGQQVAVRLIPGPDTAELSQFNLLTWLPQGLEPTSVSKGGAWDQRLRRIAWNFGSKDLDVRYAKMGVQGVISASGWQGAEKVLGREKPGKARRQLNVPDAVWNDGAVFTANRPAWFQMEGPGVDLSHWRPLILGVIFHTQMKLGGKDYAAVKEADSVRLNYSVDGSDHEALPNDIEVSRMSASDYWFDGYYDATEDRKWSWEDLSRLRAKIDCRARGTEDRNLLSSIVVTVKYYTPAKASPYFYAKVTDPRCDTLNLATGIFRAGSPLVSSDLVEFKVNDQLCAPTPAPTPTDTPVPLAKMVAPTPEPTHAPGGREMVGENVFHLGCLTDNPEPFNYAGTFVSFCIKTEADITLNVYSGVDGKIVRQMKAGSFRAGDNNQIFYNALDNDGKLLTDGAYILELVAEKNGHKEVRNITVHYQKARR